jgi:TPR repeat protein
MYSEGKGVAVSAELAAKFHEKACNLQNDDGCVDYGEALENGDGVRQNASRAVEVHKQACDRGHVRGCFRLGVQYLNGTGVSSDVVRAGELMMHACSSGYSRGCVTLGSFMDSQEHEGSIEMANTLFQLGCDLDNGKACGLMAVNALKGRGLKEDPIMGRKLLKKACDLDLEAACKVYDNLMSSDGR